MISSQIQEHSFEISYSFRSTWYFTDISKAIDFLLYFTQPGGLVVFDIMNKDSKSNKAMVAKKNRHFVITLLKNLIKFTVNGIYPARYAYDTLFGLREIMYSAKLIEAILKRKGLYYETLTLDQIEILGGRGLAADNSFYDQKLVYIVRQAC